MSGLVPLARRNLLRQRLRFSLSVLGIGLALLLMLALQAIYSGALRQVSAYPDHQGAPVIVSQRGVETMHMSSSAIPGADVRRIGTDPRVRRADPIMYTTLVLGGSRSSFAYLIGYHGGGGPWTLAAGRAQPGPGEVVLDENLANRLGLRLGSTLPVLGRSLRVVGLSSGTSSLASSIAFVDLESFRQAARVGDGASYVLVWPRAGTAPGTLAQALERYYPVSAQTRQQFSARERQVVDDMSTGLIHGLVLIALVVGAAVAALSMYTATTSRLREYAVLKAIGMGNRKLYALISRQAALSVGGGLAVALALLAALVLVVPALSPSVTLEVTASSLVWVVAGTAAIAVIAALLPARRVARVDPASVYRG